MTVKMEEGSSIKVSKEEENGGVLVAHFSLGAAPTLGSCLVEAKAASTEHSSSTLPRSTTTDAAAGWSSSSAMMAASRLIG